MYGGERGVVVRALDLKAGGPGFKSSSLPLMDLSSVAPNSTPPRFVNSQLVCLLPVGIFNKFLLIYDICFLIYSVPN